MTLVLGKAKGGDSVESILNTIKKLLGIDIADTSFDTDIIVHINSTISILSQMGIGPKNGFIITSDVQTWNDYVDSSVINVEGVKTYLYLKIKLIFDPPTNSTTIDAFNKSIAELEWRMMLAVETNNLEV
jgi:hypothetical protein